MASTAEPATETQGLVRGTLFFKKKPDISEEEFHRYWSEKHGPLLCSTRYFQERIVKYNQYHFTSAYKNELAGLGLPVMEYDGSVDVWAADLETLVGVLNDSEYQEKIIPDEDKFISREDGFKFMFGYDALKMDKT